MIKASDIAKMLDHSLLKPEYTRDFILNGLLTAKKYNVASVCVRPCDVIIAKNVLEGTDVAVSTVIGFPHGSNTTSVKVYEAKKAIEEGAVELDMVLNIGMLLSGEYDYVKSDIKAVVDYAHENNAIVKVIFENCYLDEKSKIAACHICEEAGADFVKTSTGYGSGGATVPDLALMRKNCSKKIRVKAAGGVRTLDGVLEVREIGVSRVGATATAVIMEEALKREADGRL